MGDAAATAHFSIGSGTRLGVRQRDRSGRLPAHRADDGGGVRALPGRAATSRCCGCSRRRATAWSGSSRSSATSTSIRCSSTTRCSPGRSASRTRTCGSAIREWLRSAEDWFQEQAGGKPGRAPMFAPFRLARHRAREPGRGVADGAVQGGRRLPDRLALRALRRARQGRRRTGVHRDDVRFAGGPHLARMHRALRTRARGGVEAADRLRARRDQRQDLLPGRPLGSQGFDPARLGGAGHAAAGRQLAGDVGVADPVVPGQRGPQGDGPRRHGRGRRHSSWRRPRWCSAPGST